jgi:predicted transposase/invertase (TIGR01784 family)
MTYQPKQELLKLTLDCVFKRVFSDPRNKGGLTDFLKSAISIPESEYDYIELANANIPPEKRGGKSHILDVRVHTKSGKIINIEMQVENGSAFRERVVNNSAKLITTQLNIGEDYDKIVHSIAIIITDFTLFPENDSYHNKFRMYDPDTNTLLSDILEIYTYELPKLPKSSDGTDIWDWLETMKTNDPEELDQLARKNPMINETVMTIKELSADELARWEAEAREKELKDKRAQIKYAHQQGVEEEKKKNLNKEREAIRNFANAGVSYEVISNSMNVPIEEIEKLIEEKRSVV